MMRQRFKIDFSFDGTSYKGWQRQSAQRRTVQETLEGALEEVLGAAVPVTGSSRTDAGVHALCMTAHFTVEEKDAGGIGDGSAAEAARRWKAEMNRLLPEDIRVLDICPVPLEFHSRFRAQGKHYRYYIDTAEKAGVFWRKYCFHAERPLDEEKMRQAARILEGTHDFSGFTADKTPGKSKVRAIRRISIQREGNYLILDFWGNGFLYHMVRILVGTLLEIGWGDRPVSEAADILEQGEREKAGFLAPAQGLFLVEVLYKN